MVTQQGYGKCVSMDALKSQQRRSMGMYVIKFWKPPKASKNSNNNSSSSVVASSSVSDGDGSNNSSSSSSMSKKRKAARSGAGGPVTPDAVSNIRVCGVDDEVVISTRKGIVMRQRIASILVKSRSAKGVLLQDIPEDDRIISVDVVPSVVPAAVPANSGVRATKAGAAMVVGAAREAGGGPGGAAAVKVEVVSGASTSRKGPRGVSKAAKKEEVVG